MRNFLFVPAVAALLLGAPPLFGADARMHSTQESLQSLGFYNGPVDGELNADTKGALRRFQIYKGLSATGTLDPETEAALKEESAGKAQEKGGETEGSEPERLESAGPSKAQPVPANPTNPPNPADNEADREFLRREQGTGGTPPAPREQPPRPRQPSQAPVSGEEAAAFAELYRGTPYHNAPPVVQRDTLRKAQLSLAKRGLYDSPATGTLGPETEEALFRFQSAARLPRTGRLDLDTLARLRLLPVAGEPSVPTVPGASGTSGVPLEPFNEGLEPKPGIPPKVEPAPPAGAVRGIPLD